MNRLSKSLLGGALVLLFLIISACSGNSTQQPSSTDNGTTEQSPTESATPSTEGSTDQPATGTDSATSTDGTSSSTEGATGTTDSGNESVPAAKPELTPANEGQVDITIVQQGPGQFFVRLNEFPEGYLVSNLDWTGPGYSESATFDEAVKNGQEGNNGFYASSDHRNFGFIYDGRIAGEEGKFTLTFRNQAGDELTWYKDLTLQ